jgi:hypothetical protein
VLGNSFRPPPDGTFVEAWNGKELTSMQSSPHAKPERRWGGVITSDRSDVRANLDWRTFMEDATPCSDKPIAQLLGETNWKTLGTKMIGQYRAFGLANIGDLHDAPDYQFEIWVVPDQDFAPVQLAVNHVVGGKLLFETKMQNVELSKEDNFWVLAKAQVMVVAHYSDSGKGDLFTYQLNTFHCDVAQPIRAFAITYPVGAGVFDSIGKMSFIAGKVAFTEGGDGTGSYIPLQLFPQYMKRTDFSRGLTEKEWKEMAIARQIDINSLDRPPTTEELNGKLDNKP